MDIPKNILFLSDVAKRLGITQNTVYVYRTRKTLPEQDGYFGNKPYWFEATIDTWLEHRPRPGWHGQRRNRPAC